MTYKEDKDKLIKYFKNSSFEDITFIVKRVPKVIL